MCEFVSHVKKIRGIVCIAAVLRKHPVDGQPVWFLADFNVNQQYRGKNIGALFVATMVNIFIQHIYISLD